MLVFREDWHLSEFPKPWPSGEGARGAGLEPALVLRTLGMLPMLRAEHTSGQHLGLRFASGATARTGMDTASLWLSDAVAGVTCMYLLRNCPVVSVSYDLSLALA